jgi:hypothetical protein
MECCFRGGSLGSFGYHRYVHYSFMGIVSNIASIGSLSSFVDHSDAVHLWFVHGGHTKQ